MGRLLRIEVENFKSYAGKVTVGPFPPGFSAVIGPNGGGKSNLMDAISFVLGLPCRQLRGGRLGDLVYRGNLAAGEADTFLAEEPAPQSAVVRLVYEHEPDRETVFSRTVTVAGVSTYRVDSRAVSLETYLTRLQTVHLSAGPQSFLVFQNQVEEIANRSPQQLAALFEETSNSVELRDEYERLRQRVEAAQQEAAFCLQKKRGMLAERKQYREQQDEVERYQALEQRLAQTRTERMLFRLFHVERDLNERHTESGALADEVTRLQQEHASIGDAVEQHKKELARCRKAHAALEKQITQLRSAQEQTAAAVAGTQAQVQQLTKRTAADRQRLTEAEHSARQARSELQLLQTAMRDVEEAMRTLEREEQRRRQSESGARLDTARLAALQETAARRTASLREELAAAERTALVASQALHAAERTMRNVVQQAAETEREWEQQRHRHQTLEDRAREEERTAQRLTAENESNQRRAAERAAQRRELEHIVEQCSEALRAAKAERVESAREQRLSEAVTTMRRLFPGVRGRIADLCRPVQRKYHEAVAVALGKSMGAIVVDNEDTASECIAYLKEQRAGTATFIPLREIRAPTVQAALRSLGGTARLLIDVLQFDRSIAAAVQYVAGNTVVCDTLDEARRIAYAAGSAADAGDARKVCTVDGTLIHRSGFITGGADDSASGGGASRWDEAETEALRKRRQQALDKLAELAAGSALHERAREQELQERAAAAVKRASVLREEAQRLRDKIRRLEASRQAAQTSQQRAAAEVEAARAQSAQAAEAVAAVRGRIEAVEAEVYGDVPRTDIHRAEQHREQRLELESQRARLQARIEYEQSRDHDAPLAQLRDKLQRDEEALAAAQQQHRLLGEEAAQRAQQLAELGEQLAAEARRIADVEGVLAQALQRERLLADELADKRKAQSACTGFVDELRARRAALLTECRVEDISVPLVDGGDWTEVGDSNRHGDERRSRRRPPQSPVARRSRRAAAAEDVDDDDRDAAAMSIDAVAADADALTIDYARLSETQRAAHTAMEQSAHEQAFMERERSVLAEMERLSPNLKAGERMGELQRRFDALTAEHERARRALTEVTQAWERVRTERTRRFLECFRIVSAAIDDIYKQLTRAPTAPLGGIAQLQLESEREPYRYGVKYYAMPPGKRYRDMEQLSGGERSVAALALLFALQAARRSPFLVMDEIDAALDPLNVQRVSRYLRERAADEPPAQSVVISLKDAFYENANALVGIYRDPSAGHASRVLTLDLDAFGAVSLGDEGGGGGGGAATAETSSVAATERPATSLPVA